MDTDLKVTETPTESSFADIMAGDNVINIPLFQREYKWTSKNLKQFWGDIEAIIDGSKKSQFLGVIVTVPHPRPIGVPPVYDIVDGQQRLFTCCLTIAAAVRVALDNGEKDWALETARSYLLLRPHRNYPWNTKILPAAADRQQFHKIWAEIANHKTLETADWQTIGIPTPPAPSGTDKGKLISQFGALKKKLSATYKEHGFERVKQIVEILVSSLSFVSISLRDPIAAPIIFERLNSRGERITTADLVRNEIFAREASDPARAVTLFKSYWEPFQQAYDDREISLEVLLFPYGLALDPSITKAELFQALRKHWGTFSETTEVIRSLDHYSPILFALEWGELHTRIPDKLMASLLRLHRSNLPSSIYAFVFSCVVAVENGTQGESAIVEAFREIEGFLVRRAVCGIEPSGLHAVFKGMFPEISKSDLYEGKISAQSVRHAISQRATVPWPNDDAFLEAIKYGDLYNRRIRNFVIREHDLSMKAETSKENFWVEHIVPRTLTPKWLETITKEEHGRWENTFANLLPLTSGMNVQEGQNEYAQKRKAYKDSMFASARALVNDYETWTVDNLEDRAEKLGAWALAHWPDQRGQ